MTNKSHKKGSALLLTLMVASLLMVMVLSFMVFVRMELRVVTNKHQLLQAQANAKLAAVLAIARLQELTGPDQRITFNAAADSSLDQSALEDPARRTGNWAGVRDSATFVDDGSGGMAVNTNQGRLLGWLVSGEPSAGAPLGGTADPLTNLDPQTASGWSGVDVEANGFVKLVGSGSVVEDSAAFNPDYVAAPLVDMGATGRYAWWVGDEGVKARVNLGDAFLLDSDATNDNYRPLMAQGTGSGVYLPAYNPADADQQMQIAKATSIGSLALMDFASDSDVGRKYFHEITSVSEGLPVNVRYGGLKRNLTAVFKEAWDGNGNPSGSNFNQLLAYQQLQMDRLLALPRDPFNQDNPLLHRGGIRPDQNRPDLQDRIFPHLTEASVGDEYGAPSWSQLITWVTTLKKNPNIRVSRSNISNQGLWPVVAKVEWGRYITFDRVTSPTRLYYIITPRVVLWNPYNVPMQLDDLYMRWVADPGDFPTDRLNLVVRDGVSNYHYLNEIELSFVAGEGSSAPSWNTPTYFDFVLKSETIPAGAAMVFTMTSSRSMMPGSSPLDIVADKRSNGGPSKFHLNIDGHEPAELSSVASPGEYGLYGIIDLDLMVKKLANKQSAWPSFGANAQFGTNGLSGMTMVKNGGGKSSTVNFDLRTNAAGSSFSLEFDTTKGNLSTNFKYNKRGGLWKYASMMIRGFIFSDAEFDFDPSNYIYSPGGGEIDEGKRLFHFVLGLRLPYNFSLVNTGALYNQIAPSRFLSGGNPLAARINSARVENARHDGYGGLNTHIAMMLQKPADLQFVSQGGKSYAYIGFSDDPAEIMGVPEMGYPRFIAAEIPGSIVPNAPYDEISSPASLQHANLRSYNNVARNNREAELYFKWNFHGGNLGPAFALGNSRVDPYLGSERAYRYYWETAWWLKDGNQPVTGSYASHYDYSYLLNKALWDDFTFSPATNTRIIWENMAWNENPSLVNYDFNQENGSFTTQGAFNVHSTSVRAWAAVLRGLQAVPMDGQDAGFSGGDTSALSRFNGRYGDPFDPVGQNNPASYGFSKENNFTGYRRLTPEEIHDDKGTTSEADDTGLAVEIVKEIKDRGPFMSMGDFVNRRLLKKNADPKGHRLAGAIQRAIDKSGINSAQYDNSSDPRSLIDILDFNDGYGFGRFDRDFKELMVGPINEGAPGSLSQADVLSRIGSFLQVRSDTFVIRTYGEYGDTATGIPLAKAWCEVVVQRQADYVDEGDAISELPQDLNQINFYFGRRYKIKRFRWLTEDEI